MRLVDLDPRWLVKDGRRVGFVFKSPTLGDKMWMCCFENPPERREQWALFRSVFPDDYRNGDGHALFGAGLVCTAMAVGILFVVWMGGWPAGTEHQRLSILGWGLLGALAGMGMVIVALAIGGPVGRLKAKGGRSGLELEAEDHDDTPPVATVTTTTEVKPGGQA